MADIIIEVNNLAKYFPVTRGLLRRQKIADVKAMDGVSFAIHKGETLGLVVKAVAEKQPSVNVFYSYLAHSGEVIFEGRELCELTDKELVPVRAKLQMIFQDPYDSLDPRFTAMEIIGEPLRFTIYPKARNTATMCWNY